MEFNGIYLNLMEFNEIYLNLMEFNRNLMGFNGI